MSRPMQLAFSLVLACTWAPSARAAPKCDVSNCYFESGLSYAPNLKNASKTEELSIQHCQARCSSFAGCEKFTFLERPDHLPRLRGECTLQGPEAAPERSDLPHVIGPARFPECCFGLPRRVSFTVTFGAVATSHPAAANPGETCMKGVRVYNENFRLPGGGAGRQVDASAIFSKFPHARLPVLVLRNKSGHSEYLPCKEGPHDSDDDFVERMPFQKAGVYMDWGLHPVARYDQWLRGVNHEDADAQPGLSSLGSDQAAQDLVTLGGGADATAAATTTTIGVGVLEERLERYINLSATMSLLAKTVYASNSSAVAEVVRDNLPGYRLVGRSRIAVPLGDTDTLMLLQKEVDGRCSLIFEGADTSVDLLSLLDHRGAGFCGFHNTHAGIRSELRHIVRHADFQEGIRRQLPKCSRVTCVGHSLGGSLCDLFTLCANSGRSGDPDFDLLGWEFDEEPTLMDESVQLNDIVRDDGVHVGRHSAQKLMALAPASLVFMALAVLRLTRRGSRSWAAQPTGDESSSDQESGDIDT